MVNPFQTRFGVKHVLVSAMMAMGVVVLPGLLSGCAAPQEVTQQIAPESLPYTMETLKIEQLKKIGKKEANGGYFALVTLQLENRSKEDLNFLPEEFAIQNVTNSEEERYRQGPEDHYMDMIFSGGQDEANKLLNGQLTIHPRFKMEKILIFQLPEGTTPEEFELVYKPSELVVPLVGPDTEWAENPHAQF